MGHCIWCDHEITEKVSWRAVFGRAEHAVICASCQGRLQKIASPLCHICGRSLADVPEDYVHDGLCHDCLLWEKSVHKGLIAKNRSLYHYNTFLREMIAQFKFRGMPLWPMVLRLPGRLCMNSFLPGM